MRLAALLLLVAAGLAGGWWLLDGRGRGEDVVEDPGGGWVMGLPGSFAVRPAPRTPEGLGGIGYATGTEPPAPSTGVVSAAEGLAPGLTLLCHGDAAAAELVDERGEVVHRWALPYAGLPGAPPLEGDHQRPWRAVELLQDGDLVAIHSGRAMVRVRADSSLVWARYERFHHDVITRADGVGLALARTERIVEEVQGETPIVDDLLVEFDLATGEPLRSLSLWDALAASPFAELLTRLTVREGDVMHANGLALLDADFCEALDVPGLEAGAVLVSMRDLDLVVAVDLDAGRAVWVTSGPRASRWRGLHDPTPWVDDEGAPHLLVFDNLGGPGGTSRLLDLRLADGSIAWSYEGAPPSDFDSLFCGTVERLPDGHVLTAESMAGRVLVIDPESRRVLWEYASPHLAGEDERYVAAVFEAQRATGPLDWLER
ncbi:MAG: arylsulfotransferase family protein [Planctomycetota bacterium]|nr:arylsulfotransferase family protein [Planctomycetota bacterium]